MAALARVARDALWRTTSRQDRDGEHIDVRKLLGGDALDLLLGNPGIPRVADRLRDHLAVVGVQEVGHGTAASSRRAAARASVSAGSSAGCSSRQASTPPRCRACTTPRAAVPT